MADAPFLSIEHTPLLIKSFNYTDILQYTQLLNDAHNIPNDYTSTLIKGQKLFADRFVTGIGHRNLLDDKGCVNGHAIRATVKAEMRKLTSYEVTAVILPSNKVKSVTCPCPGGVNPACCKHAFAVLSAIEDYSRKELFSAPTEKLQTWHKPKVTKVSPKKYAETLGAKGAGCERFAANTSVDTSALSNLHPTMPIFSVLSGSSSSLLSDEVFYNKTIALPIASSSTCINTFVPDFLNFNEVLTYHQQVRKTLPELQKLEKETMSQSTSVWHQERKIRVTASRAHEILHCTNKHAMCDNIISVKDLSHIPPIQLGKRLEPMVKNMLKSVYKKHIFRNTGLVVHPDYPFLGASPDGLLFKEDDVLIVEIKCIYNPKHMSLHQLIDQRQDFCLQHNLATGSYNLKPTHKYYTQIQMQLFCSGVEKCLFVLFFDFGKPFFEEIIEKDSAYWNSDKLQVLSQFYFSVYLPKYIAVHDKS